MFGLVLKENEFVVKSMRNLCGSLLLKKCPQYHGHKRDTKVTFGTCGAINKRAQVSLVYSEGLGCWECLLAIKIRSHEGEVKIKRQLVAS